MKKIFTSIFIIFCSLFPFFTYASSSLPVHLHKGQVLSIEKEETIYSPVAQTSIDVQSLQVIVSFPEGERVVSVENDYTPLKKGQKVFVQEIVNEEGRVSEYRVSEPNRLSSLLFFTVLFLVILFLFGGKQGVRGLLSLIISLVLIIFVLLPNLLLGYSPILVSLGVSAVIIVLGSYITHGFNRTTTAAVFGMLGSIIITGILAYVAVESIHVSGFASEESVYLKAISDGKFNIQGLLLSGFLIGLLGVLYDAAISQAILIEELLRANPTLSIAELYKRGIRVGREHIGALVDTLAIAYVGASLPLLLLVVQVGAGESLLYTLNREIFATEIIRTLVGSIGLILAVPLTTYISVLFLKRMKLHTFHSSTRGHHHH